MALTIEQARKLLAKGQAGDARALATVIRALLDGEIELNELTQAELLVLLAAILPGDTQVLFDDGGAISGDPSLTWDKTQNILTHGGRLEQSNAAAFDGFTLVPAAGSVYVRALKHSTHAWLGFMNDAGFKGLYQPMAGSLWRKVDAYGGGTSIQFGGAGISVPAGATAVASTFAATNFRTRNAYSRIGQAAAVAALGGLRLANNTVGMWFRSGTVGLGGFRAEFLFALGDNATGYQFFCGMTEVSADLGGDASALTNIFGVGFDAADASNSTFFINHNDGAGGATRVATTGITRNITDAFRLILDCPVGSASTLYYHFTNMNTGTIFSGTITTNLPTADTVLRWMMEQRSGAVNAQARVDLYAVCIDSPLN